MKTLSLKIIVLFVAVSATFVSCKKLDGPEPSTKEYLTSKTWTAYAFKDVATGITIPVVPGQCQGFVVQFATNGTIYQGNGCTAPTLSDVYVLVDKTITLSSGPILQIDQINGQNMTITVKNTKEDIIVYF